MFSRIVKLACLLILIAAEDMRENCADGVRLKVNVEDERQETILLDSICDPKNNPSDRKYKEAKLDLSLYSGHKIT